MRRLRRLLVLLLVVGSALGLLGLAAFTWIAYWPLEGRVAQVAALVPGEVDFVLRTSWHGLRDTRWIQTNVLDDPLVPEVEQGVAELKRLLKQIDAFEAQINAQIPLGVTTFSVDEDVVPDEVVVAGKWCAGARPEAGPPTWYEILALTRVSWKAKLFAALKHGFVRDRIDRSLTVDEIEDGIFRFTFHQVQVSSERARECGPGQIRPPENVAYATRVKDVLAFSNSESLIRGVTQVAEFPDSGRGYLDRPNVQLDSRPELVAASTDVKALENYLVRMLEWLGPPVTVLQRYLTIPSLDRLNGYVILPSVDQIRAHADVRYEASLLGRGIEEVYGLPPADPRSGVATLVPREDTFAALLLKTPPLHLIRAIYEDVLSESDRVLWQDNLRRMGGYKDIDEFFVEFAGKLDDTAGIAVGRLSEEFDALDYPGFFADPEKYHDPNFPALAMMVRLKRDTSTAELDQYLAQRVPLLGGSPELEKVEYRGLTYTRLSLQFESADFWSVRPAWILAQDHFIFASNESYFRKILDTLIDPRQSPPLRDDPSFRAAMDEIPPSVHVGLYVDLSRLLQVPPTTEPGGQPRGFLWDRRNLWVRENRSARSAAIQHRRDLEQQMRGRTGRALTEQQQIEIERQVDELVETHRAHYPEFIEEYRRQLAGWRRLRALGVGIVADGGSLTADLAILFLPSEGAGAETAAGGAAEDE